MTRKPNKRSRIQTTGHGNAHASSSNENVKALKLPVELLMEIASHFKGLPDSFAGLHRGHYSQRTVVKYLERTITLRSLSQTCKFWRTIFFPLLWKTLDVYATYSAPASWYRFLAKSLIKKCTAITLEENKIIAQHVRSMTVILSTSSASTVLPIFVQGLKSLPNLKLLYIVCAHDRMGTALQAALKGHTFPQIETIALPIYTHHILRSCPNVKRVICVDGYSPGHLIDAISKACKKVEEIERFNFPDEKSMKSLVKATPNLRSIKLYLPIQHAAILKPLTALKNLSHITLPSERRTPEEALNNAMEGSCIKVAKDILRQSKSKDPKSLVLKYDPNSEDLLSDASGGWSKEIH
ncbi:hypothetical protein JR316_0012446 [Psilocybe cubensis]|uniref:Uncharacterized protein n=2 Tax=Psilocybe cubensis TaxID=181762 RepID=A0ACB8GIQ7_PSICU|nr:hypothetical protein JR316_0012446 [Psilocybe cubensis]KAH9475335.1 hypothetical protein JR316_0012446 [Psilocybe cubensis]